MNLIELNRSLVQLRMSGMAAVMETRLLQAQSENMVPIDLISTLVSDELACRSKRLLERRHKQAQFRDADKRLDNFNFEFNPKMNRNLVFELATAGWIGRREDALFIGPPGSGKSHCAQAIGHAVIQQGYRVLYREAHTLLEELADATLDGRRKPAPGLALNTLSALPEATLERAFVVGDNVDADGGLARCLSIPFVEAHRFRTSSVDQMIESLEPQSKSCTLAADKVSGVLVGMAVGDALGAAIEFWPRSHVSATYPKGVTEMRSSRNWALGEYTDDTQMALLLADSLLRCRTFDATDIAQLFVRWSQTAKDVGIQISRVVHMPAYNQQPESAARLDYGRNPNAAAGNGAVMRCAPIALFHQESMPMLLANSRRSARLTHGDPKAQASCVLVNCAIDHFLKGGDLLGCFKVGRSHLSTVEDSVWHRLDGIARLPKEAISSSGYTVTTVEAAFWSLLRSSSFEEAVVTAASLGDDADTVAAVTGTMAGAYYGYDAIPDRWKKGLLHESQIHKTALQLAGINAAVAEA